jgi:acetate kinase
MKSTQRSILTINGGSSSIKFALYEIDGTLTQLLSGEVENIGTGNTILGIDDLNTDQKSSISVDAEDYDNAASFLIDWLEKQEYFASVSAIGHRVVHGMKHTLPELITHKLLLELKSISAYDPDHLPGEIKLIELFRKRYPSLPQISCFDTAFHTSMPIVAKLLPIPRRYYEAGIHRYGFHGLSYAYLMEELQRVSSKEIAHGKIILAHLGSGASLAAVNEGKSIDTSMGFTPASGLVMGTRTGDLDPGVAWYLMQSEKISSKKFNHLINNESGLLGLSETSADMRELMKLKDTDNRAAEAVELFCYQAKKWIGSFAAALGGVDTLVFSGGIGEHAPKIREYICDGMKFMGVELDNTRNTKNDSIISTKTSKVVIRVIKTNEELMIGRMVCRVLNYTIENHD